MLTVTDDAATAMRVALEKAAIPSTAGMRISADRNASEDGVSKNGKVGRPKLRLDVVTSTYEQDEVVVAPGGLQVFIEPEVLPLLEDKMLDGEVEESGRSAFRIVTQRQ
jgi:Fe-S cluster assembly iron-binding protein IscA